MTRRDLLSKGLFPGLLAGLIGGIVASAALSRVGALPATATLVRSDSVVLDFILNVILFTALGGGFGVLVWHQNPAAGETLFWGLTYGALWWFLGPLTLTPLLLGGFLAWDLHSAQESFGALLGDLTYGAITGLVLAALRRERGPVAVRMYRGAAVRGAVAGLIAGHLVSRVLGEPGLTPLVALVAGVGFALLYPAPPEGSGPGLVRGSAYGFLCWIVAALTLQPLVVWGRLAWSLDDARAGFAALVGYLLFGAAAAILSQWLDGAVRLLFSEMRRSHEQEGAGVEGLRAVGRGTVAGLVGGALFVVILIRIGGLGSMATLVGSTSPTSGLFVQMIVSVLVGISYGLLFRRQSFDVGSGLGWGLSYGFLWWVLGPLTLTPLLLGTRPAWTPDAAAASFPYLIGHLAYGAGLGIVFHLLEARQNPWWIPTTRAEAARVERRKAQLLTSAPALWALVVAIALLIPVLLGE